MKRLFVVSCLMLFAAAAFADVLHLKSGGTVEGVVVEETDEKIVIRTKFGVQEYARADVDRVEKRETPEAEFDRRATEAAGDADKLFELYLWAKTNRMTRQAQATLRDIIKVDPDHENARKLLGYVRFEDRWVTEKEFEKLQASAARAEMEKKGLVEYKGKWMTPEEKEAAIHTERGEIQIEGEWVNKRDFERRKREIDAQKEAEEHRARGEYLVEGKWVSRTEAETYYKDIAHPYQTIGQHAVLSTNRGIDFGDKMLVTADAAYRTMTEFFGKKPEGDPKIHIIVADKLEDYNALGTQWGADKSSSFSAFCSGWQPESDEGAPDMISVAMYYQSDQNTEMYVKHAVAEQYVMRLLGRDTVEVPPRWFIDGVASYVERWQSPKLFTWSRDRLRNIGWILKLKTLFKGSLPTEQSILQSGMLVAFLKGDSCPEELKQPFHDAVLAINERKNIQKAFRELEKVLEKQEEDFEAFANG